jgi:hypothetical protein
MKAKEYAKRVTVHTDKESAKAELKQVEHDFLIEFDNLLKARNIGINSKEESLINLIKECDNKWRNTAQLINSENPFKVKLVMLNWFVTTVANLKPESKALLQKYKLIESPAPVPESEIKPFQFNGQPFMPYPQRKPKDMTPIRILTKSDEVFDVIQIDTGFGREFTNQNTHVLKFPDDIKGWWYLDNAPQAKDLTDDQIKEWRKIIDILHKLN